MGKRSAAVLRRVAGAALAALLVAALAACGIIVAPDLRIPSPVQEAPAPQVVRMAVCWAALPLAEDLRAAYTGLHPEVSIELTPMDSAHVSLAEGLVDLAIACAPDAEAIRAQEAYLEWRHLATDALAIVVNRELPLTQISRQDLEKLYAGYVADWSLLGAGHGTPSFAVLSANSAARRVFDSAIMVEREVSSAALVLPHDQAVLAHVAENALAIGYLSAAYLGRDERVVALALDQSLPTWPIGESTRYPLRYELFLAEAQGAGEEATRLAAFALGRTGRALIGQRYGLPE